MVERRKFDTKFFELVVDVKSAVPIYEQIKNSVKMAIFSKKLQEGDKIISIREVSSRFKINPITIMKAYSQLETEGLLFSKRGSGYFVQVDEGKSDEGKLELFHKEVTSFLKKIAGLGFSADDLMFELKKIMEEKKHD